ncbi:hypothetical protein [Streptomyces sp. NPDC059861]|uniref:hypothetical protein n=1 Tax=Streptomyces sp. NPDC059861 TaxID=3346974 RepID=UPI003648797D
MAGRVQPQGHSRLDAYAAVQTGDEKLATRGEAARVSANDTALYGLAAIENLALLGDRMPPSS